MNFKLTIQQLETVAERLEKALEKEFSNVESVCGFSLNVVVEGGEPLFEVGVFINKSYHARFNDLGKRNFKIGISKKVHDFLNNVAPVERVIHYMYKDC
jgi:hypothetical protein